MDGAGDRRDHSDDKTEGNRAKWSLSFARVVMLSEGAGYWKRKNEARKEKCYARDNRPYALTRSDGVVFATTIDARPIIADLPGSWE